MAALAIGVVLVIIFLLPFFLNADSFRPTIEAQLSNSLGRTVTIGKLSFSLMHGSLIADEFVISDDPAFSDVPFLQAKSLDVGVEIIPVLLHHQVVITGITIDAPSIQLLQHASGMWNYASLGGKSNTASSVPDLSMDELKIVNGSAMVSTVPVTARPFFEVTEINLTIKKFSFLRSFPLDLAAKLPGGGTLKLTGEAGPMSQGDVSKTPFHATLQLREFDPVAASIVDKSKGISMSSDVDGDIRSDSVTVTSAGKIKASQLQLVPGASPAQQPVDIDYSISQNLATREGIISDIAIHAGSAAMHVNGSFKFTPETLMLNLHLSAAALPIEQLESLLPAVDIRLPSGSSLQGGTLTANLAIIGPATSTTVSGPVEIDTTKLAGFDLGSKIEGFTALRGTGTADGTEIRVLKASVNSSPQDTRLTNIVGDLPQFGTALGDGTVLPSGELDFRLTAKLNNSTAGAGRAIPLTITGTAASPSIRANAGAMPR